MAILAAKFIHGAASELQSRVFLNPWMRKTMVQRCSTVGESSKDFPVRYTPKKSKKVDKLNDTTPCPKDYENYELRRFTNPDSSGVEFSNAGERLRRGLVLDETSPDHYFKPGKLKSKEEKIHKSVARSEVGVHDYKWRSAESKFMEELHEFDDVEGPEEVSDDLDFHNGNYEITHLELEPSKTKEAAEKIAIRLVAARAYTALDLKKKLIGKKFSREVVDSLISEFQDRGLINDLFYAEAFSRSRWASSSWGPRRIKQALAKKGVNDFDAQKAIKLVLEDGDDQFSSFGLSKPSMDHLLAEASKQWLRSINVATEKRKSRMVSWLQYRGFNWGVISFILKKLQSQHPP